MMRLATVLLASLEKRFRRLKNDLDLRAYSSSNPEAIEGALAALISTHVDEAFMILIDEVDLLNDFPDAVAFLDTFLERTSDQVAIVVAGREVLNVSLARLMAEGALAGFGPHDLALDRDEVAILARVAYGESIEEEESRRSLKRQKAGSPG